MVRNPPNLNLEEILGNSRSVSSGSQRKRVLFIGDPHGRFDAAQFAINYAHSLGVDDKVVLGDLLYDFSSSVSQSEARRAQALQASLRNEEGDLYQAIKAGEFRDEQLARLQAVATQQLGIVEKHAQRGYELFAGMDSETKYIAGNWDMDTKMREIFGERFLYNQRSEIAGMKAVIGGGGGQLPVRPGVNPQDFACDNGEKEEFAIDGLAQVLLDPELDEIAMLVDHCGIPSTSGGHVDRHSSMLERYLFRRHKLGMALPKVVINGHHHSDQTKIEWREYTDLETGAKMKMLNFAPGVLAQNHNEGSRGTFTIAEYNDDDQLVAVDEYHVQNHIQGIMKVVHFGRHTIDHENEEVEFTRMGKVIHSETERELFEKSVELDANYALEKKGFVFDYSTLNIEEKDLALRQSWGLMSSFIEKTEKKVQKAFDTVRLQWEDTMAARDSRKMSHQELRKMRDEVIELLSDLGAKELGGIDFDALNCSDVEKLLYRNAIIHTAFGITESQIEAATSIKDNDFENIPHNWGGSIFGRHTNRQGQTVKSQISQSLQGRLQQQLLFNSGITTKDYQDMFDQLYAPQNITRTRELTQNEALNLYVPAAISDYGGAGLVASQRVMETAKGAYTQVEDFEGKTRTTEEVDSMYGIVREKDIAVFTQENDLHSVGYDAQKLTEALEDNKARLIGSAGNIGVELAESPGAYFALDSLGDEVDVSGYDVIPKWQADQEAMQQKQQRDFSKLLEQIQERGKQENTPSPLLPTRSVDSLTDYHAGVNPDVDSSDNGLDFLH